MTPPCGQCVNFDPQILFRKGLPIQAEHGRCAARSVYPTKEEEGQRFPPGVKRAAAGELPQLLIVWNNRVEVGCGNFIQK